MGRYSVDFCDACGKIIDPGQLYKNLDVPVIRGDFGEDYPWDSLNERLEYRKRDLCEDCFERFLQPLTTQHFPEVTYGVD